MAVVSMDARVENWWNNGEFFTSTKTSARPVGMPNNMAYRRSARQQVIRITVTTHHLKMVKVQNRSRSKRRRYQWKRFTQQSFTAALWHEFKQIDSLKFAGVPIILGHQHAGSSAQTTAQNMILMGQSLTQRQATIVGDYLNGP